MLRIIFISQVALLLTFQIAQSKEIKAKIDPCVDEIGNATTLGTAELTRCIKKSLNLFFLDTLDQLSEKVDQRIEETGLRDAVQKIDDFGVVTRVTRKAFSNVIDWTEIPGSRGAAFCALSRVDDDTRVGRCEIHMVASKWEYRTGGGSDDQVCTSICLFVDVNERPK